MDYHTLRRSDYSIGKKILVYGSRNKIRYESGEEIDVQSQLISVLTVLAVNSGEVVSREDIIEQVWEDFYTGDLALNQSISRLRKILGDSPANGQTIETVIKHGYRLVPPVRRIQSGRPVNFSILRHPVSIGAMLLLIASAFYFSFSGSGSKNPEQIYYVQGADSVVTQNIALKIQELAGQSLSQEEIIRQINEVLPDSTAEGKKLNRRLMIYE